MNKKTNALLFVGILIILGGCGHTNYKKTAEGMVYDIIPIGQGPVIKHGDLLKIHFKFTVNDSITENTYDHMPVYGKVDTTLKDQYSFTDILPKMRVGDSAVIILSMDTLKNKGYLPMGYNFLHGTLKKGFFKILKRIKNEQELANDYKNEETTELQRETDALKQYLDKKNITAVKTPNGVFVQIHETGSGETIDSGKTVKVFYTGKNLKGEVFDSNVDSTHKKNHQPFEFQVGNQQVIAGWDEGLKLLKQGGKATLYIPAMMAYKNQMINKLIPPFSSLIFNVEVVEVKNAKQ